MADRALMAVRVLIVVAFLVGMPVLALPQIADWVTAEIYFSAVGKVSKPGAPQVEAPVVKASPKIMPVVALETVGSLNSPPPDPFPTFPARSEPATSQREQLAACETELQNLGAIFYRLEQVPGEAANFRLIAQFERAEPLPERFQVTTTAADPASAMRQMIDQVRSRRSAARP